MKGLVSTIDIRPQRYMMTLAVGAVGGGLLVAWATKALPRMMSGMMKSMMANMEKEGFDPKEM